MRRVANIHLDFFFWNNPPLLREEVRKQWEYRVLTIRLTPKRRCLDDHRAIFRGNMQGRAVSIYGRMLEEERYALAVVCPPAGFGELYRG